MGNILYWEDVQVGQEVPTLRKFTTHIQLVKYAGAEEDFFEFHVNEAFAQQFGLPHQIDHGFLKNHFLSQLMVDWIGIDGTLKKLGCQYRKPSFPNNPSLCKGVVKAKRAENGEYLVDCDIWIEDGEGEKHTTGYATVALPSREALIKSIMETGRR